MTQVQRHATRRWQYSGIAAALLLSLSATAGAQAVEHTKLMIRVVKQAWKQTAHQPFAGIGVFDLLRGNDKFGGASCPDRSSTAGEVICLIPCRKQDDEAITLRVRPPSDQDGLTGWVTPPEQQVKMQRCKLVPGELMMRYDDARYALNELANQYVASLPGANPAGKDGNAWLRLANGSPDMAAKFAMDSAATPQGRAILGAVAELGASAANRPLGALLAIQNPEVEALKQWQVLSKSALLQAQVLQVMPEKHRESLDLRPTSDVGRYRANLLAADRAFGSISAKTPEQQRLVDDIKALRSASATGRDSEQASDILRGWKYDASAPLRAR
jgi:hypothetical protein